MNKIIKPWKKYDWAYYSMPSYDDGDLVEKVVFTRVVSASRGRILVMSPSPRRNVAFDAESLAPLVSAEGLLDEFPNCRLRKPTPPELAQIEKTTLGGALPVLVFILRAEDISGEEIGTVAARDMGGSNDL